MNNWIGSILVSAPLFGILACGQAEEGGTAAPGTPDQASLPLCVVLGPDEQSPGIYGSDLGITVAPPEIPVAGEVGQLAMLFGDTWAQQADACSYPVAMADDLYAFVPQKRPNASSSPDALCSSLSYEVTGQAGAPEFRKLRLFNDDTSRDSDNQLDTGMLRTPVAGFSGRDRRYGIFVRARYENCASSAECPIGMNCSEDPGYGGKPIGNCTPNIAIATDTAPLLCLTDNDCPNSGTCSPAFEGVCLLEQPYPRTSDGVSPPDWFKEDPRRGVAVAMRVGGEAWADQPEDYASFSTFVTNKFVNVTARTVAFFDPADPDKNDYRFGHHTLLLWGRTSFATTGDYQSLPFMLYHPIAELTDENGAPQWTPHYFAGYGTDGKPRWSDIEADAAPIYGGGDGAQDGVQSDAEFDYVNQMSMVYLEAFDRWVMLYGGSVPAFAVADAATGLAMPVVRPQPSPGAVHLRSAAHPFGKSSADADPGEAFGPPRPLLTRLAMAAHLACDGSANSAADCTQSGDATDPNALQATLSSARNRLSPQEWLEFSTMCTAGAAALDTQYSLADDSGGHLYGVNVIEQWTENSTAENGEDAVDIYWNVSTWNPYEVVLIKSQLQATQL